MKNKKRKIGSILLTTAIATYLLVTVLGDLGVLHIEPLDRIPVYLVITLCFCVVYLSYRINRPSNKTNGKRE